MEDASGTSESVPSRSRRKDPGRPSGPAKTTAKRARPRAAVKAASRAKTASRSKAAGAASRCPRAAPNGSAGPPWRRTRNRVLYNRRLQRADEHWRLPTRLGASMFSRPDLVLSALGASEPVEADGRVLNRNTQALLELARRFPGDSDGRAADPAAMRSQLTRMARLAMPVRTDVHVTGRVIRTAGGSDRPSRSGSTASSVPASGGCVPPAIVYFHGGGWVTGDLDSHDSSCRLLAAASGCIVVAVSYRLAPEDPFPAAVDDALEAYAWVQRNSDEVGHAEGQVGVMGDSAGGNLAAVVAMETRAGTGGGSDVPAPVAQGLVYPALDARLDSGSARSMAEGFLLTTESMEYFRGCYVPDRSQWENPRVSPLLADDHHDLAPALVVTAGFDPLRDDGAGYAEVLEKAGVAVEYRCYDDQVHGFMVMGMLPDSLALATEVCDAMGRLMRRSAADAQD